MDTTTEAEVTRSEHFPALLEAGLPQNVAEKLDELYVAGKQTLNLYGAAVLPFVSCVHTNVRRHHNVELQSSRGSLPFVPL